MKNHAVMLLHILTPINNNRVLKVLLPFNQIISTTYDEKNHIDLASAGLVSLLFTMMKGTGKVHMKGRQRSKSKI